MKDAIRSLLLWVCVGGRLLAQAQTTELSTTQPAADHAPPYTDRSYITLGDGTFSVDVLLPDAATGHYRGPRFIHGGMVAQVRIQTSGGPQEFLAQCTTRDDPTAFDANAVGLAEEFSTPLGYEDVFPSETDPAPSFVKIGIGSLGRNTTKDYAFSRPYPILFSAPWAVVKSDTAASFTQSHTHPTGYGYLYTVGIITDTKARSLRIKRSLSNTGTRTITTRHYSHHFFGLHPRSTPVGPGYRLTMKGPARLDPNSTLATSSKSTQQHDQLTVELVSPVPERRSLSSPILDMAPSSLRNFVLSYATASDGRTSSRIEFSTDSELQAGYIWLNSLAFCPETFTSISLRPGEQLNWSSQYVFSTR